MQCFVKNAVRPFQTRASKLKEASIPGLGAKLLTKRPVALTTTRRAMSSLITTQELASRLDSVKVLDGSWHMPNANRDPYKEYLERRIPGARFFGIDEIKDKTVDLPHMLPTPEAFAEAVGQLGISNDDTVVVYDSTGFTSAARVYWTFKVCNEQERMCLLERGSHTNNLMARCLDIRRYPC